MFNFEEVVGEVGYVIEDIFFVEDCEVILEDSLHTFNAFGDINRLVSLPINKKFHLYKKYNR